MSRGIVLYGAPASGKDTITAALSRRNPAYQHFERLKCGPGRTHGYRMITPDQLAAIRAVSGEVLWENRRYGAVYLVTRTELAAQLGAGQVPVVHLGQAEGVNAVTSAITGTTWLVVELHCPRDVAAARIIGRSTENSSSRLRAFDDTESLGNSDLRIDTSTLSADEAARLIDHQLTRGDTSNLQPR